MTVILVYLELAAVGDGEGAVIHRGSLELAAPARAIAEATGGAMHAALIGHNISHAAEAAASVGASKVYLADAPAFDGYRPQLYRDGLRAAMDASGASIVLAATTASSRDFLPRVAVSTGAMLATDCTAVEAADGALRIRRQQYSGKCVGEFVLPAAAGQKRIVSIRPNTFAIARDAAIAAGDVEVVPLKVSLDASVLESTTVVETVNVAGEGSLRDVTEADIIVTGGRSLKSEANFGILYELADAIGGAVGATRAAVDAGYQPHARQIGLTGKMVAPRLYFACGVHGAIQHLAGMRGSQTIVAININRDAPIYEVANYGCVADLFELVPALTRQLRNEAGL